MTLSQPMKRDREADCDATTKIYLRLKPYESKASVLEKVGRHEVITTQPDGEMVGSYEFEYIFESASQSEIFDRVARPIVDQFITKAEDGLICAIGYPGSGKRYTMDGDGNNHGLVYRTIDFLFDSLRKQDSNIFQNDSDLSILVELDKNDCYYSAKEDIYEGLQPDRRKICKLMFHSKQSFLISMTMIEIEEGKINDLLEGLGENNDNEKKSPPEIITDKSGKSYVANVVEVPIESAEDALKIYRNYAMLRNDRLQTKTKTGSSHLLINLILAQLGKEHEATAGYDLTMSRLSICDLAISKPVSSGENNESLKAMGECIRSLRCDKQPSGIINHQQYTITRLLTSNLNWIGNVRIILCVNPSAGNEAENASALDICTLSQDVLNHTCPPAKNFKKSNDTDAEIMSISYDTENVTPESILNNASSDKHESNNLIQTEEVVSDLRNPDRPLACLTREIYKQGASQKLPNECERDQLQMRDSSTSNKHLIDRNFDISNLRWDKQEDSLPHFVSDNKSNCAHEIVNPKSPSQSPAPGSGHENPSSGAKPTIRMCKISDTSMFDEFTITIQVGDGEKEIREMRDIIGQVGREEIERFLFTRVISQPKRFNKMVDRYYHFVTSIIGRNKHKYCYPCLEHRGKGEIHWFNPEQFVLKRILSHHIRRGQLTFCCGVDGNVTPGIYNIHWTGVYFSFRDCRHKLVDYLRYLMLRDTLSLIEIFEIQPHFAKLIIPEKYLDEEFIVDEPEQISYVND